MGKQACGWSILGRSWGGGLGRSWGGAGSHGRRGWELAGKRVSRALREAQSSDRLGRVIRGSPTVDLAASFECAPQRELVCVLELATSG